MEKKQSYSWVFTVCLLVILVGIFFRVYRFNDFLSFKLDQARDTILISHAVENGPGELPLLGPRAGGTYLRLGPVFYYFEYLSAVIFQSTAPPVLAYPNLLFSIFSIPLFYLFVKKYFTRDWSMALTALFSLSFLMIEYSRFAWNPNALPFFNLLFLLSLLNVFDPASKRPLWWAFLSGAALAVSSQLHFTSFITIPVILALFLFFQRKMLRTFLDWKKVAIFFGAIFVFYLPVILSDVLNSADNLMRFIWSINAKSSNESLLVNLRMDAYYFGKYFIRIITGFMDNVKWLRWSAAGAVLLGAFLNWKLLRSEEDSGKKNFLLLSLIWFTVVFISFIPLAENINRPRFFLPVFFVPYLFLGYLHIFLSRFATPQDFPRSLILKSIKFIPVALLIIFGLASFYFNAAYLQELSQSQTGRLERKSSVIMKAKGEDVFWTWNIFDRAVDFINSDCQENRINYYMPKSLAEYIKPFEFVLQRENAERDVDNIRHNINPDAHTCYYYVYKTGGTADYLPKNDLIDLRSEINGDMTIVRFALGESYMRKKETVIEEEMTIPDALNNSDEDEALSEDSEVDETDADLDSEETTETEESQGWLQQLKDYKEFLRKLNKKRPTRSSWNDVAIYFKNN